MKEGRVFLHLLFEDVRLHFSVKRALRNGLVHDDCGHHVHQAHGNDQPEGAEEYHQRPRPVHNGPVHQLERVGVRPLVQGEHGYRKAREVRLDQCVDLRVFQQMFVRRDHHDSDAGEDVDRDHDQGECRKHRPDGVHESTRQLPQLLEQLEQSQRARQTEHAEDAQHDQPPPDAQRGARVAIGLPPVHDGLHHPRGKCSDYHKEDVESKPGALPDRQATGACAKKYLQHEYYQTDVLHNGDLANILPIQLPLHFQTNIQGIHDDDDPHGHVEGGLVPLHQIPRHPPHLACDTRRHEARFLGIFAHR
mmetsp:Transcript_94572/g.253805  ORF Transcript_94572/g.253805 Transcript_94572/m.253805 type:complete len:306 (+) Transcript_94572:613-1530(+)